MADDLTLGEQKHVRTALRLLRLQLRSWNALAKAIRFQGDTLEKVTNGRRPVTASMALRVARLVDITVDELLVGKYVPPGTCPHCGHPPDFADDQTVVEANAPQPASEVTTPALDVG